MTNQPQIQPVAWYPQQSAYQQMQQQYNGYSQPYGYQPQQMQRPAGPALVGRPIGSPSEIKMEDIPMDGRVSFFPLSDLSGIIAKQWTSEGTIATIRYVPEQPAQKAPENDPIADINSKLDRIQELLAERKAPVKKETAKTE